MISKYLHILEKLFLGMRLDNEIARDLAQGVGIITLLTVAFFLFFVVKFILKRYVGKFIRKTKFKYDDYFLGKKLERRIHTRNATRSSSSPMASTTTISSRRNAKNDTTSSLRAT